MQTADMLDNPESGIVATKKVASSSQQGLALTTSEAPSNAKTGTSPPTSLADPTKSVATENTANTSASQNADVSSNATSLKEQTPPSQPLPKRKGGRKVILDANTSKKITHHWPTSRLNTPARNPTAPRPPQTPSTLKPVPEDYFEDDHDSFIRKINGRYEEIPHLLDGFRMPSSESITQQSDVSRTSMNSKQDEEKEYDPLGAFGNVKGYNASKYISDAELLKGIDTSGMTDFQLQDFLNRRRKIMEDTAPAPPPVPAKSFAEEPYQTNRPEII
eukprot:jgi/Hompol1/6265/HPOL_000316-RA